MKMKSFLSLLMVLCLLFSLVSPVTAAVQTGSNAVGNLPGLTGNTTTNPSGLWNDRVVSSGNSQRVPTLRDQVDQAVGDAFDWVINNTEGTWSAVLSDIKASLLGAQLPECIQDLREAAKSCSSEDVVAAFVVLKEMPLVNFYSSINAVPALKEAQAQMVQDAVISQIEEDVLDGEELAVISQYTYLTNAIVVETEFGNLEQIACVDGVETVFLSPVFYPCETDTDMDPQTVSSGQMSAVDSVWNNQDLGYTGEGMTIAILDTGLDLDHPSFAADPEDAAWDAAYVESMLSELNAALLYTASTGKELTASDLYYSSKVPFRFNYAVGTTNVGHNDGLSDHGTHVAGIAAANEVEGTGVVGMAPDAQIIAMKVFNSETGGANMYDILNALEDAMRLGCDVANLSLGSAAGFSQSGVEVIDEIFASISKTEMIVDVAAGNEGTSAYGSQWGNYLNTTDHVDTSTISSPSTYVNAMSIASVDNVYVAWEYFTLADGTKVFFQPSVEYLYGYTTNGLVESLAGTELEYVMVPGLGDAADFYDEAGNSIVSGKIAVISRGTLSFAEKAMNAEAAGAAAVLIWNNVSEDIFTFGMTTSLEDGSYPGIPVALISLEDGQKMADAATKAMTVSDKPDLRMDSNGGQMSSFSSWGVTPDLKLVPDITGVGGNVYSCYDGGQYGPMSGTSMATPQVAGITALVLQYLQANYELSTSELRTIVDSLMMSTAEVVIDNTTNLPASPRQQGAGLVNALYAVTAESYLTVNGGRPKADLGDNETGSYSFTFTVHNFGDEAKTYTLSSSLLCENYVTDENHPGVYFMAESEHALDNSAVSFNADSVTVPAGGSAEVTVSIDLTAADKQWIDTYFANGNYVEGFVYLTNEAEEGVDLSLPFLGFYGDWTDAPLFDTGYWFDNGFWIETDEVEANQYYHVLWTSLGESESDWVLGFSPYTGALMDANGDIYYTTDNNVISPNGDGVLDNISEYYLSLMRNAKWVYLTYTDENGNVLDMDALDYISKTMYNSNYGGTVPFVYTWYYDSLYDFTDANGEYLADGTELTLTISGVLDYEGAEEQVLAQIPIHIDTVAPTIVGEPVQSTEDGINYLTLTVADDHLSYVLLMNSTGTQTYGEYTEADFVNNGDGTYTVKVDVTNLGDKFTVALCDYGCNEGYYDLTYTLTENAPEMDTSALYAYQVYDLYINYYYGWDYMFGWTTLDKATAAATMISSDANEYYALTAAEYAGGYVFAVDAGYNFLYMIPGVWSRNVICNLGVNVVDMAFDEKTQTMYLATNNEDNGECCLYTVDLLTGDLTLLNNYYMSYSMPWAMTFVDGNLYCCMLSRDGFFQVDLEGGTYSLTPVTDADGNEFKPVTAAGGTVMPYNSQSMTYSQADGLIYWAYYNGGACELIAIDPETWTNTAAAMPYDQEYVGLLTLEDDGYTLPESTEITKLVLSDESLILAQGESYALTATTLPWNAPAGQVTWTSSDESVAIVNENGVVTAVAEGTATVTATLGDLSVSCSIAVVNISGNLYAYNYYSGIGYGNWMNIDLQNMTYQNLVDASPVDFIAADYNGHDGKIYGYDLNGGFYSFDPATGECIALGSSSGSIVYDMAYDYSTGLMYAIVPDYNSYTTTICYVNMTNGSLTEAAVAYDIYFTLACDLYGYLYAISYDGIVYTLSFMESSGGGIGGWEPLDISGDSGMMVYAMPIMMTPVYGMQMIQSMCYDHVNDVLLWANPETGAIYWLDIWADEPYAVNLGEPTGSGLIEFTGMFTLPAQIPELPYTPVESLEGQDMMLLVGGSKLPSVSVYPLNATNQTVTLKSNNETVAKVENGMIVGVSAGTTTVTATLVDGDVTHECTFTVTVKNSTDNIYGYLSQDMANYNGYVWIEIPDTDPNNYYGIDYVLYNGTYMTLYAAEYVDGYIYAYGYDDQDWEANFQYLIIDPETWSVISGTDMGDEFPFVYDMAYDYTTGTMYALAGTDSATDLYMVNMATGRLIQSVLTEPMFMSLAIDANGTIYAMAESVEEYDPLTWTTTYSNAMLYTIDVETGTYEPFMDTGVLSNMLASMAYDYDTGYLYWTGLFVDYFSGITSSGLYLIDPADMSCNSLGTIGAGGSQVTSLMIIADEYPETPDTLQGLTLVDPLVEVAVDGSTALEVFLQPSDIEVEMVWTSEDESVATVDENGVVTGVSAGTTTITVTVEDNGNTFTASCTVVVYGVEDYFLTYNWTDGGFASIGRPDTTDVTNLTEGETESTVRALAMVNGVIYAYDTEGNLFTTTADDDYVRTYIGGHGIEVQEDYTEESVSGTYTNTYEYEFHFVVRDMAWDAANNRMLAVGCHYVHQTSTTSSTDGYYYQYEDDLELSGGCKLYEVDLQTGAMTELCVIGGDANPESGVQMLTVTDSGDVYVYSTFRDYVSKLDAATGEVTYLSSLQTIGAHGSTNGAAMAMAYDAITNNIYLLITQNGTTYTLYKFNVDTTALNKVGEVGLDGDSFAGLAVNTHIHEYEAVVTDATCTEDGCITYTCDCGDSYTEVIEATGHSYELTETVDATCTEDGHTTYTCSSCGDSYDEVIEATGHSYTSVVTAPTATEKGYTTHTCEHCGDSYVDSYVDPDDAKTGDAFQMGMALLMIVCAASGAVLVINRKKLLNL